MQEKTRALFDPVLAHDKWMCNDANIPKPQGLPVFGSCHHNRSALGFCMLVPYLNPLNGQTVTEAIIFMAASEAILTGVVSE